ncbi:MAG: PepSY-associated TM helix domain-containing protein [Terriglobus sp.]
MMLPPAIRKTLFWSHLSVGIAVGVWVAFLATTGSLIAFQTELVAGAEHRFLIQRPSTTNCVSPSAIYATVQQQAGRAPTSLVLFRDAHKPAEVQFGRSEAWLVNGCRGTIIAPHVRGMRAFLGQTMELHYALSFRDVPHPLLREVKNAMNLGFSFLVLSGLFLWIPRRWTWQHTRPALLLRRRTKGRARFWNWHNVAGIWFAAPLLLISVTGTIMAYPWASNSLHRIAHETPPSIAPHEKRSKPLDATMLPTAIDTSVLELQHREPRWERIELRLSRGTATALPFSLEWNRSGDPHYRILGQIDPVTGRILTFNRFNDNPRGLQWRYYARFLHTGELFGKAGKLIAVASCLAALLLVWTGFSLSWKRWQSVRYRRNLSDSRGSQTNGVF